MVEVPSTATYTTARPSGAIANGRDGASASGQPGANGIDNIIGTALVRTAFASNRFAAGNGLMSAVSSRRVTSATNR